MAKALKTAAIVVGVAALVATGLGAVAGLTAAGSLFGVAASTFTAVGAIAGVAAAALTAGSVLAAPKPPGASLSGSQDKFTANKDQGIPYPMGRTGVAGFLAHRMTFDTGGSTNNAYQTFFGVLGGGGPIYQIESFKADQTIVSFSGENATGTYAGSMFMHTQLGAKPESAALPALTAAAYPAGWSSASKLSGYAAFAWTVKFDTTGKKFPGAVVPKPMFTLKGNYVYDPRLDSTYPGGSGSCRALNEATYVYSENPWLHALTWALGRWQNGKRVLGIGFALAALDLPSAVYAANVADANGWKIGGCVYSTDGKWEVLKKMCAAGSGEPIRLGGQCSFRADAPRISLATITTADLIGDCSVKTTPQIKDRINGVIPTYRSEDHDWSLVPASLVQVAAYVTADGRPKTRAMTWELVQDVNQAAELATYAICNAREFGPIVLPLRLKWAGYRPGDCLTIASDQLCMTSQMVIVTNRHLDPATGAVTLTLRSETYAKHAFALGQTATAPATPGLQVVDRSALLNAAGLYTWTAYADSADGLTNFTNGAAGTRTYIGQAFNQAGAIESTNAADYAWTKFVGPAGTNGTNGTNGAAGTANNVIRIFKRSATTLTSSDLPTGTCTFTFATTSLTGLNNGWTTSVPAADGNPLYESAATASGTGPTDTIAASEWASPILTTGAGVNAFTVTVYKRAASPPAKPTGTTTYTFSSGAVTGLDATWSTVPPVHDGNPLYYTTATALGTGVSDTISSTEWATPQILAQDGADGSGGQTAVPITQIGNTSSGTGDVTNGAYATFAVEDGVTVNAIYDGILAAVSGTGTVNVTTTIEVSVNGGAFTTLSGSSLVTLSSVSGPSSDVSVNTTYHNSTGARVLVQVGVRTARSGGAGVTFSLTGHLQFG